MAPLTHFSGSPPTARLAVMIRSLFVLAYEITLQILTPQTMQILAIDFLFSISQSLSQEERDERGL